MDKADSGLPDSACDSANAALADSHGVHSAMPQSHPADPPWSAGGVIPGLTGVPAFSYSLPDPSPIPVVIAVPHAGRAYSAQVLGAMRHPQIAAPRLEDRLIDLIGLEVARATGAGILIAHAPRAMIDLNRGPDDIDWDMIVGGRADGHQSFPAAKTAAPSAIHRARSGLGLVPRRLPALGDVWRSRLEPDELAARINNVHVPYHEALGTMLEAVCARWGAVLLIDLHSMPPLASAGPGDVPPRLVVGDRFGAACDGTIVSAMFAALTESRWPVAHNRPYAGGYVLERHARRHRGVHGLQLEIDRQAYLDGRLAEPGPGYAGVVDMLAGLVRRIAVTVAECGRGRQHWRAAAE
ncbi:N-formylglutamate amidohydrolase [Novosphingobium sp. FKTRR1]|uniref:N-formylglutamate amidohydrolase n=1 Tax=Novosphingobium sp. FKTRR1 TaxID=2879118 RepID=UPI001CF06D5B|nr:N-formylglutamate amidohydrolase [Novosphingobium sp. FKTRR1]